MGSRIELSEVITDIAAGPFGSNLKVSCFVPSGFPIIDGANLKGYKVTDNLTKFVTEEKARSLSRSIAKRGEVVVTISGTLGQISYIPDDSEYPEYLCSQRQFRVAFDNQRVYVPYLVFYFHTREGQSRILAFANQTGVPALSQPTKNFKKIVIDLPDMDTQQKIARIAENINSKIELNQQTNDYLSELAHVLYRQFLSNVKAHGNGHLGTLDELITVRYGKDHKKLEDGNIPVYGSGGLMRRVNASLYQGESVLIPRKGSLNNVMYVNEEFWTVDTMFYTEQATTGAAKYVYEYLIGRDLVSMNSGSAVPSMTTKNLDAMEIYVPSNQELLELDTRLEPLWKTIQRNRDESESLAAARNALLPKLMSGEIDVSKIELP